MDNTPNYKNSITLSNGEVLSGINADLSNENIGVTKSKIDNIIINSTPNTTLTIDGVSNVFSSTTK